MIVRPRPRGIEYFLVLHGSILPTIWLKLTLTVVTAVLVTLAHGALFHVKVISHRKIASGPHIYTGFQGEWKAQESHAQRVRKLFFTTLLAVSTISSRCFS